MCVYTALTVIVRSACSAYASLIEECVFKERVMCCAQFRLSGRLYVIVVAMRIVFLGSVCVLVYVMYINTLVHKPHNGCELKGRKS